MPPGVLLLTPQPGSPRVQFAEQDLANAACHPLERFVGTQPPIWASRSVIDAASRPHRQTASVR